MSEGHWWRRMSQTDQSAAKEAAASSAAVPGDWRHSGEMAASPPRLSLAPQLPSGAAKAGSSTGSSIALMRACTRGDLAEATALLKDGADPCQRGEFGATALIRAAEQGHAVRHAARALPSDVGPARTPRASIPSPSPPTCPSTANDSSETPTTTRAAATTKTPPAAPQPRSSDGRSWFPCSCSTARK